MFLTPSEAIPDKESVLEASLSYIRQKNAVSLSASRIEQLQLKVEIALELAHFTSIQPMVGLKKLLTKKYEDSGKR